MTGTTVIPETRGGRAYRRFLVIAGLCAVVGLADAGRALLWLGADAVSGLDAPLLDIAKKLLLLAAWGLIAFAAWDGWRRNVLAATWLAGGIMVLMWALILMQKFA